MSAGISAMIFTLNEEIHLPSCLESLGWCDDVIVIDSFSADGTERIAAAAGARFFKHEFAGFGSQRNWAMENAAPRHEWILILDADERVTPELAREMARAVKEAPAAIGAFRLKRRFYFMGRWLRRSALYPSWLVRLIRKDRVRYVNRGHAETQIVEGAVGSLRSDLLDENLKGLDAWNRRQERYAEKEAEFEIEEERTGWKAGSVFSRDPLRRRSALKRLAARVPMRPLFYFVYAYLLRGGLLEGAAGLTYCAGKYRYYSLIDEKKKAMRR